MTRCECEVRITIEFTKFIPCNRDFLKYKMVLHKHIKTTTFLPTVLSVASSMPQM